MHGCPTGMPSGPLLPVSANASSCYMKDPTTRHPTLAGRWMSNGGPPQWVSFNLQLPRADAYGRDADNSTPVLLVGLAAEGGAGGDGNISASTSIYVCADDTDHSCTLVSTCHGGAPAPPGQPSSKAWGWWPPKPVRARSVLLNTTVVGGNAGPYCCEGWVALDSSSSLHAVRLPPRHHPPQRHLFQHQRPLHFLDSSRWGSTHPARSKQRHNCSHEFSTISPVVVHLAPADLLYGWQAWRISTCHSSRSGRRPRRD